MPGNVPLPEYAHPQEAQETTGLLASNGLLRRLVRLSLDLIFPARCAGCGRVDYGWCPSCQEELDQYPLDIRLRVSPLLAQIAATGLHSGKLRTAVHALKYDGITSLATTLAQRQTNSITHLNWIFDMLVPVPLHTTRLKERGYNQSQLLCAALAAYLECPSVPEALYRIRDTGFQVGLNKQQRLTNVADAFRADPKHVKNHTILLVDDVFTTGATLEASAQALLNAGAHAVYGLTVSAARS